MASPTIALLQRLHEESRTEIVARARAQFQGSNEDFLSLAEEYDAIAPVCGAVSRNVRAVQRRLRFPEGSPLSLAVSPETGGFLRNMVLSQRPARILELGSSCGVSTLYFAEALRTLGRGVVVATERDALKCAHLRAHVMTAGLDAYVDMREGDVFETVAELDGTFDMVFFDVWADAYLRLFKQIERLLRRDRSYWPTTCTQPRTPFDRTSTTSITTRGFRPRPWTLNRESNLRSSFIEWRCRRCGSSMGSRAKEHRRHPAPRSISAAQMQNPAFRAGFLT